MSFELPALLQTASTSAWLWPALFALTLLVLVAKLLTWLATHFERCTRCDQVVRVGQHVCHHCFKAVKPPQDPVSRATRPIGPRSSTGR